MLVYILHTLDRRGQQADARPPVAMVHLAVEATTRMVQAAVVQAVGTGATVGVVRKATTKIKREVVRSQKWPNTRAEISIRRPKLRINWQ